VRRGGPIRQPSEKLSPQQALALIEEFKSALRERWSYYAFSAATIEPALASLPERAGELSTSPVLALELQKIVALGIDGHADVRGWRLEDGFLPFLIEPSGDRFVAFSPGRDRFLADDLPFIISIDGRPIGEWCRAAETLVPKGSPGYVRRNSLRQLRNVEHWRGELGLARGVPLHVELASADGSHSKTVSIPVDDNLPQYGVWPRLPSRVLPENVGYLRLESMDDAAIAEIIEMMPRFRNTKGLVVDVRDNGGGSREPLRWLFTYLTSDNNSPRVVNCARYRLYEGFADDHLTSRFLYPANSGVWDENERAAIAEFQKSFRPEWQPPENEFSDWHYMVLSRLDDPRIYHYSRPIVVLLNEKCFSATDVFLAALKGTSNVTLVGTTSGGGSARAESVRLGSSSISVRLGSMVSFMRNGQLFDRNGVEPDVVVQPEPDYFVGRTDRTLQKAIEVAGSN
jgi:Peptidase family S41